MHDSTPPLSSAPSPDRSVKMVRAHVPPPFSTVPGLISQPAPEHLCLYVLTDHANIVQRSAVESPPTWGLRHDNQLPSSRPVLERLCPRCVPGVSAPEPGHFDRGSE